jgi:phosphatidylinositol glycan class M
MSSRLKETLAEHSLVIGLVVRLFLAWFLPWLLDDGHLIPEVSYTDIDYLVFTDAANHVAMGQSPYDRHTYRYTPFLAQLLAFMPREGGRYIFCIADTICGWIILRFRSTGRSTPPDVSTKLQDAFWWLYNPLAINICTRGSAESLMVLLPVLLTLWIVHGAEKIKTSPSLGQAFLSGLCHGVAIHSKLYPIIYTLSYMAYFATPTINAPNENTFPWTQPARLFRLVVLWVRRIFQPIPILFLVTSIVTFVGLTYLAVRLYGERALEEGLLYHFSRVDHRHNYSMYWYWIYLARARTSDSLKLMGGALLLPQFVLLVYSSLGIAPYNLGLALFIQTYLFVIHNKVITAQYFTWYLCLLPICSDSFSLTLRVKISLIVLLLSIGLWLGSAYCLEMQGWAVHKQVWIASVIYFFANVNMMGALLRSCNTKKAQKDSSKTA